MNVVCINADNSSLILHDTYHVENFVVRNRGQVKLVRVSNIKEGYAGIWLASRFAAESPTDAKAYDDFLVYGKIPSDDSRT